jgi:nitrate reductase NapAB chaperone NapD
MEEVIAAEVIQRQVAAAVVVGVEKALFLIAVQFDVGGIEVECCLTGHLLVGIEKERMEQLMEAIKVEGDPVIAAVAR